MRIIPNKGYYIIQVISLEKNRTKEIRYIMPSGPDRLQGYQKVRIISSGCVLGTYLEDDIVIVHANTIREFDLDGTSYYMISERDILGKVQEDE